MVRTRYLLVLALVTLVAVAAATPAAARADDGNDVRVTRSCTAGSAVRLRVRERDGDPAFLRVAMDAMADLRKLLGLDAPTKLKLGGLEGAPPVAVAVSADAATIRSLTSDQLRAMDRYYQELTGVFQPSDLADMGRDG